MKDKGEDKEEYAFSPARENGCSLKGCFRQEVRKVALEPEGRTGRIMDSKPSRFIPVSGWDLELRGGTDEFREARGRGRRVISEGGTAEFSALCRV